MNEVTVPLNQAVMPLNEVSPQAREKVLVSYDKVKYEAFRMSKTEKLVCEVMVETGSLKSCIEACWKEYKRKISHRTINHWMKSRVMVREYMMELMERKGMLMGEVEWESRVADAARGDKKLNRTTPMMYKLYAEKKGWMKGKEEANVNQQNINIQILQADGKA